MRRAPFIHQTTSYSIQSAPSSSSSDLKPGAQSRSDPPVDRVASGERPVLGQSQLSRRTSVQRALPLGQLKKTNSLTWVCMRCIHTRRCVYIYLKSGRSPWLRVLGVDGSISGTESRSPVEVSLFNTRNTDVFSMALRHSRTAKGSDKTVPADAKACDGDRSPASRASRMKASATAFRILRCTIRKKHCHSKWFVSLQENRNGESPHLGILLLSFQSLQSFACVQLCPTLQLSGKRDSLQDM